MAYEEVTPSAILEAASSYHQAKAKLERAKETCCEYERGYCLADEIKAVERAEMEFGRLLQWYIRQEIGTYLEDAL